MGPGPATSCQESLVTMPKAANRSEPESDVRERIFASALHHFSRKGYAATSLREICEDARTTKPMVYYYFGSKDELYSSVVKEILKEMAIAIRGEPREGGVVPEDVIAYGGRYLDYYFANEDTIALVLLEVIGLGGAPMQVLTQGLAGRVRRPLEDILRRGMDEGVFVQDDVGACAAALTGILTTFILAYLFGTQPLDRDAALRQIEYYVRGITRA